MAKREPDPPTQIAALQRELEGARELRKAYVLKGEERYFVERGIALLVAKATELSFEVSRHDGGDPDFSLSALLDDLAAAPMFATGRVVVVRRAEKPLAGGKDAPLARAAVAWLKDAGQVGSLVLAASSLRADNIVAKAVKAADGVTLSCRKLWDGPPPWDPDPRKAENVVWLMKRARELGVRLDSERAVYIAAAVGNDLFALEGQLERLKHAGGKDVREVVELQNGASPFALAEDLCMGDLKQSIQGIEGLFRAGFQGSDGTRTLDRPALVAILLGSLRKLCGQAVRAASLLEEGGDPRTVAKAVGVPGHERALSSFGARMQARPLSDWSRVQLELLEVERRTRTGAEVDANDFCALALSWARKRPARR